MARNKKRPQYVTDMVKSVNERLRQAKVKDPYNDTLFMWICDWLMKRGYYQGYNFYIDKYNDYARKVIPVLAGTADPEKYDYLQIY